MNHQPQPLKADDLTVLVQIAITCNNSECRTRYTQVLDEEELPSFKPVIARELSQLGWRIFNIPDPCSPGTTYRYYSCPKPECLCAVQTAIQLRHDTPAYRQRINGA